MISFITGKVGGGKTLLSLIKILEDMSKGLGIATNIRLNLDACDNYLRKVHRYKYFHESQYTFLDLNHDRDFRDGTYRGTMDMPFNIYIDEAQIFFNSKDDKMLKEHFSSLINYITQTRKLGQNLFFITQAPQTVVSQFRMQTEEIYYCVDMRKKDFPLVGKIPSLGLRYIVKDYSSGEPLRAGSTPVRPLLYNCFDTTQFYDTETQELADSIPVFQPITKKRYHEISSNPLAFPDDNILSRVLCLFKNKKDLSSAS